MKGLSLVSKAVRAVSPAQLGLFDFPELNEDFSDVDFPTLDLTPAALAQGVHMQGDCYAGHTLGQPAVPLYIAFSGGRTSAMMTEIILRDYSHRFSPVHITFANTGQEHQQTIEFVYECQKRWEKLYGTSVVWLEAVVNHAGRGRGYGTSYRVVDYFSCTMHWNYEGPFTEVITKYGLPSPASPNVCNRELKLAPQAAYRRELKLQRGYEKIFTAVGIREDEPRRYKDANEQIKGLFCYPMADLFPTDKQDVADFWENMPFNLELAEELGNCVTCWKKGTKKLASVALTSLNFFKFFETHEAVNGRTNVPANEPDRRFFRNYLSSSDIIEIAVMDGDYKAIKAEAEARHRANQASDNSFSGCTSECQAFASDVDLMAELEDGELLAA